MAYRHIPIALETASPVSPFDDPECQYLAMPQAMATFTPPSLGDWRPDPEGLAVLRRLAENLADCRAGQAVQPLDLATAGLDTRRFLDQVLGLGENTILLEGEGSPVRIHETVFAGVWWLRRQEGDGRLAQDYLEVGPAPRIIRQWLEGLRLPPPFPTAFPAHLMNAPALVHELFAKSQAFQPGGEEILNLSLLPLTPEDLAFLVDTLGLAGVSILSKGYGECRISRTRLPAVWWVQYFNSTGQMILNTLELTDLPAVVNAAPEDLEDSAARLAETMAAWA